MEGEDMAFVDYEYYISTFKGTAMKQAEFDRMVDIASDVLGAVCNVDITEYAENVYVTKAICYQIETLYLQGGIDAISGKAVSGLVESESLDDYSISSSQTEAAKNESYSLNGIPVSPLAIAMLRQAGIFGSKWVFAGRRAPYGF